MSENNKLKEGLNAITLTAIFEASALNRDEKLGGNIPSIKKLTRFGNKTFGYLSRVAMRHYLFETLSTLYKDDWEPAQCIESGSGENKVVQFDLTSQNIITHAELDAFGYMFTIGGQSSITRKAPVGITKAIALETWEGDMQFNANHDLAKRCGANPNPVNKEEQMSYFKVSFTIDIEKLGYDEWWIKDFSYDGNSKNLTLFLSEKGMEIELTGVEQGDGESNYKIGGKEEGNEISFNGLICTVSKELMDEKTEKLKNQEEKKYISFKSDFIKSKEDNIRKEDSDQKSETKKVSGKKKTFKIYEYEIDDNSYQFTVGKYSYDTNAKTLTLSMVLSHTIKAEQATQTQQTQSHTFKIKKNGTELGQIEIKEEGQKKKAIFKLSPDEKNKRLCQILTVLYNGLCYHVSGENYGIVPKFIIAAALKLPIPIFNSFVELSKFENLILQNEYIIKVNESKTMVYIHNPENLIEHIDTTNLFTDWNEFLKTAGIECEDGTTSSQS
ncbi:MAG: type I-B CRISPR-associated protein Cas7/Cst2/DevR [Thermodesulfovibrio sp.]|nr:type I-B CRISPR-associated protein Cas7/Cst2/DevR [Thermodesulfovibrio sp.]